MSTEVSRKLFNVHDCQRMVDAGILRERERVELIEGEMVDTPGNSPGPRIFISSLRSRTLPSPTINESRPRSMPKRGSRNTGSKI